MLAEAKADATAAPRAEFMIQSSEGKPVWFELVVNAFPPGGPDAYQVAIRDLTAKRLIEAEYRHAQKIESIGQLAAGIAHDFNNLLTVINGFSEILLEDGHLADSARIQLQAIHQAGDRAVALTRQLLAFSRKQILSPVELDLNSLVSEIEKMLRRLIGEDMIVKIQLAPALGRIKADPGQIEQILINLAVNARDAMSPGGVLTIETRALPGPLLGGTPGPASGGVVRLTVADTGSGMSSEVQSHLFEPFYTTKEPGKGTGLGLATVYGIVKQSGGTIQVFSAVGQGTKFVIDLPQSGDAGPTGELSRGVAKIAQGTETILLTEDEELVRSLARMALKTAGYTVLTACDGEDALRVSRHHDGAIHILVTDLVMPRLSGRPLADSLRKERPEMKVLYISGYTDDAVIRGGALEAEVAFLPKPYTPSILLKKIREVLDR
jgi:signal transduction histidine kinase